MSAPSKELKIQRHWRPDTAGTGLDGASQQLLQVRKAGWLGHVGNLCGNLQGPKSTGWIGPSDSTVNPFDGQVSNPIQSQ